MIDILFYLTALLFSLGQLARVSFYNQQVNFYLYEVLMVMTLFALFFKYGFKLLRFSWEKFKPVFVFLGILLVSLIIGFTKYSLFQNAVGFLYWYRLHIYFLYFFYLSYHLKNNKDFYKVVKRGFYLIAILTIFSTLVQYFFYPDLRNLIYQGWDPHLYRTFGVFFDTSIAAAIFGLFFLMVDQPIIKIFYLILVALSFSRSVYIGLFITLVYLFIQQKQLKKIFLFLIFFLALVFFIPKPAGEGVNLKRLYSIESRIEDYRQGFKIWKNSPIIGFGYDRIRYIKQSNSIHSGATFSSSFLTILVSSGLFGLASFVLALWSLSKSSKIAPILLIFLSLISLFDNILLHPFILYLLFISLVTLFDK